ncbi:MAG: bifunctional hydroxymethylpyrimidine kinase/phosphomethylpyrimidine kinase [Deltaproteobacteria bacterium]|nr:bifunctional hydroxymethylpyrimidine kinase/phosphomethylpyrimidine kinase [Deltaproteobacteria bacterium]MBZ0220652.1 bifunctional hydroxymethylpyrimidine kinase/phosphomethylpyrimidine kinase [Deltaproteobacteria bacterium]
MKTVLTIAGSDPSGGAGLQRDLLTFHDFGVRGLSVAAALTAQNSTVFRSALPVPARFISGQAAALLEEFEIHAVKIGMAGSPENLRAIKNLIKKRSLKNVVLDPVLRSTSGKSLLTKGGLTEIRSLLALTEVVTPNLDEAAAITGVKRIIDVRGMELAASRLFEMGARYALVKGGHLEGEPVDVLFDGLSFRHYRGRRLKGGMGRFHGTGCILSSALAADLAKGKGVEEAAAEARAYLVKVLKCRPGA